MHHDHKIGEILAIRHFNRFYTREFGFLQKSMLGGPFSLVEARTLYELAARKSCTASDIAEALGLDAGYLSRIVKKLELAGLITREQCSIDGRCILLSLSEDGMMQTAELADTTNQDIAGKLENLRDQQLQEVVAAMHTIETTLNEGARKQTATIIRSHRPGDIGWITSSQGKFYADVYGFNEKFEALVARICADFISAYDPKSEHCWIAELDGKNVGSIMLVREDKNTAKLRLFYVDKAARGLGLGTRLVDECIAFAKHAGYARVVLYTNACLEGARRIYERAGFHLIAEQEHSSFGDPQLEQDWVYEF